MCACGNCKRAFLWRVINFGFLLGLKPKSPASRSLVWIVDVNTLMPCSSCILVFICGAVLLRFILLLRTMVGSCLSVVFRLRPGILRSLTMPVIRCFLRILLTLTAANSNSNSPLWIAFFWQRRLLSSILQAYPRLRPRGPYSGLEMIPHQAYTTHFCRT